MALMDIPYVVWMMFILHTHMKKSLAAERSCKSNPFIFHASFTGLKHTSCFPFFRKYRKEMPPNVRAIVKFDETHCKVIKNNRALYTSTTFTTPSIAIGAGKL